VAVAALVLFQFYNHLASKVQKEDKQERSKKDMFEKDEEQHKVRPDDDSGTRDRT
jgi:hypothetical protein